MEITRALLAGCAPDPRERCDEMASGGKKKTTMAKLARENRLRERRLDKQARKDARKPASDSATALEETVPPVTSEPGASADAHGSQGSHSDEAVRVFSNVGVAPSDPRAKEVALTRLRESSDEELAVFEDRLRGDALDAGASEQEMRQAQRDHPGHGA